MQLDSAPEGIDAEHFGEQDGGVRVAADDLSDRRRDVRCGEARRCDLVEERLKEMMVAAVDERDEDVGAA